MLYYSHWVNDIQALLIVLAVILFILNVKTAGRARHVLNFLVRFRCSLNTRLTNICTGLNTLFHGLNYPVLTYYKNKEWLGKRVLSSSINLLNNAELDHHQEFRPWHDIFCRAFHINKRLIHSSKPRQRNKTFLKKRSTYALGIMTALDSCKMYTKICPALRKKIKCYVRLYARPRLAEVTTAARSDDVYEHPMK